MTNSSVLIESVSGDLAIKPQIFEKNLEQAVSRIKIAKIPKPDGFYRQLHIAPRAAKLLQYWVMENILDAIPIHRGAAAFYSGASILDNAKRHRHNYFFLRIDFKNFFPSLTADDVCRALEPYQERELVGDLSKEIGSNKVIRNALFVNEDQLAMGFPISPILSNIIMNKVDSKIEDFLHQNRSEFGTPVYSRYADDIVISIKKKGFGNLIRDNVTDLVQGAEWPTLSINQSKTKFGNRRAGSAQVTGLRITPDGRITLHRRYKDKIRLLTALAKNGKLSPVELSQLRGHLNYARGVDPAFFGKLMTKSFGTLEKVLS